MPVRRTGAAWDVAAGGVALRIDGTTGRFDRLRVAGPSPWEWEGFPGGAAVRDDRLRRTFDTRDARVLRILRTRDTLTLTARLRGSPAELLQRWTAETDAVRWDAELSLPAGAFRSCAIMLRFPLPLPIYPLSVWAATEGMPTKVHRHGELTVEYGDINSGTGIPAVSVYDGKKGAGLLLAMPFDFPAPLLRFRTSYREEHLQAEFDMLALRPGRPARASLLFRGTPGDWRPALGWLHARFPDHFRPRSRLVGNLWGGCMAERPRIVTSAEAREMARLGLKWFEVHEHFPGYGEYHPEGVGSWTNRDYEFAHDPPVTPAIVRRAIRNLHAVGAAAMPYIQVTGDGDERTVARRFPESRMLDLRGRPFSSWVHTIMMNGDESLPFGRDIVRQIRGLLERYPECDGVFLDQACYNFMDTAHDDGVSAYGNRPVYMGGFNYRPHLELLSRLLHPRRAIMANGPFGISIMPYIDGVMAEGNRWFCEKFRYYCLEKPLYFYHWTTSERDVEYMLQTCLLYGAGWTVNRPKRRAWVRLYDAYRPLLERLARRRWVYDADPLGVPQGYEGSIHRGERGDALVSLTASSGHACGSRPSDGVAVRTADAGDIRRARLLAPGVPPAPLRFGKESGAVVFDVPAGAAMLIELSMRKTANGPKPRTRGKE